MEVTKKVILKNIRIDKLGENTVFIRNDHFNFSYTVVEKDRPDDRRYFGGLQCNYSEDSEEFKNIENWLCTIVELLLNYC